MELNSTRFISIISLLSLIFLSGCKSTETIEVKNGFISNYKQMENVVREDSTIQQRWTSRKLTRKIKPLQPQSFFIKPVIYYPNLTVDDQFNHKSADMLKTYFDTQLKTVVAKHFPISTTIGPGVFVLEPAITSMRISLEDFSPLEVLPFKAVVSSINYAIGGRDRDVEVRLESKIKNGANDDLLVTSVLRGEALQLENDTEKLDKEHIKALLDSWVLQWDKELANYKSIIEER
ncbi:MULTISPECIES: DUF3313 domain-containing protein [unclassified Pseudoalteromonas]|uniref:DUF3313 domain-containing protein n=1 Tax=unclassified Pseudoalteromonas TaxID=194690 RepID=UPI0005A90FE8|nr:MULTISPECIES: DUF3313 domain-containing protein [unclassified Pseudoalteromonas]